MFTNPDPGQVSISHPAWIKFDLDRPHMIDSVALIGHRLRRPRDIEIMYSKHFNGPYTSAAVAMMTNQYPEESVIRFGAADAQYWKLVVRSSWQITTLKGQDGIPNGVIVEQIRFHEALEQSYGMSAFIAETVPDPTGWSQSNVSSLLHGPWSSLVQSVQKTWYLPAHSKVRIQARFWSLDSWNSGETASMQVCDAANIDCVTWWQKHRASPTSCDGWQTFAGTIANPFHGQPANQKCYFDIDEVRTHRGPPLHANAPITVVFKAVLDSGDEAWGFSDVKITIDSHQHDLTIDADYESEGDGVLTVESGVVLHTNDRPVMITAWDVDLAGSFSMGAGLLSIHGAQAGQTIGLGKPALPQSMRLDNGELSRITSRGGLTVGSSLTGSITLAGVMDNSTAEFGTLRLLATGAQKQVVFNDYASSFNKGITVEGSGGVVLSQSVTTKSSATLLITGTGALTVRSTYELSTSNQMLSVTADDIHIGAGSLVSTGAASVAITAYNHSHEIGIGSITKAMTISNAELALISSGGLTIGDSFNAAISVADVTATNTSTLSTLTLVALATGTAINVSNSEFNCSLVLHASQNLHLAGSVTTTGSSVLDAGTGTLTISAGGHLSTTNQQLTVTADAIDLSGTVDTGTATITLMPQSHREVHLGAGGSAAQLKISSTEFGRVSSAGLVVGAPYMNRGIRVSGLSVNATSGVLGTVTLLALTDDSQIVFDTQPSTFHGLATAADNGVVVKVDLTASTGSLYLDGDADNSATSDDVNTVGFTDGVSLTANTFLTLEASGTPPTLPLATSQGMIVGSGSLTLQAGAGVTILDHVRLGCTLTPSQSTASSSTASSSPANSTASSSTTSSSIGSSTASTSATTKTSSLAANNPSIVGGSRLVCAPNGPEIVDAARLSERKGTSRSLVINADMYGLNAGVHLAALGAQVATGYQAGKLTVAAQKLVATTDSNMMITAYDIDLTCAGRATGIGCGSLSTGSAGISIHASRAGQSIGIGLKSDMSISDAELQQMHVGGATTIGELVFRRAGEVNCSAPDVTTETARGAIPSMTHDFSRSNPEPRSGWHCGKITVSEVSLLPCLIPQPEP